MADVVPSMMGTGFLLLPLQAQQEDLQAQRERRKQFEFVPLVNSIFKSPTTTVFQYLSAESHVGNIQSQINH